ncbi:hypothetical protein [Flectobacillus roseus]|uniref:Uncharacterized protein n=1 Tax=Flectobacillus roseus TaxID=502259 RepID=A0ABT6YF66_9BACT|nr:hypothetical protein [Flectobacillus roseus]MDI9862234.1 hypothetical protein [Flectobacillus roseus]
METLFKCFDIQWYHKSSYKRILGEFEALDELLVEMLQQTLKDDF